MTATDSYLLLRAFCDELGRCGLQHACTSPGSRCTPIVLSLVREPAITTWSHIDERCAGFFALGAARASGRPVAMTCTSGTATANYLPAVIEAHHARVPLIVLTADRPPELREVGAGQAIDQLKLYGDAVRWFFEVGVDTATAATLRWIRQLACRAYGTAAGPVPGPVHLNFPLREPLVLAAPLPPDPVPGRTGGRPWVRAMKPVPASAPERGLPARGVVVAGYDPREPELGAAAARFAERAGYPLLADPLSGARRGAAAIATYDLLLRDPDLAARLSPELVLRVGDLPTSKPLRAWLARLTEIDQVALDPEARWPDPAAVLSETSRSDPAATLDAWGHERQPQDPEWLAAWRAADQAVTAALEHALGDELSEPSVTRRLGDWLPREATLFVASSMPIRDVELFFGTGEHLPRVLANRGANGIDGTVSSAFGVVAAGHGPVVLLIGDVALAHDIGGLLAARRLHLNLTIVLINNDGGGIFSFLPVSGEGDAFEEHVATPHGLEFARVAELYGLAYERATTGAQLSHALERGVGSSPGPALIEVRTDRGENVALHRRLAEAGLAALRPLTT
ncbi:MAG: 2-succinyl-5-enolpyruvyl-6-hydroxy-3-cyclohexene-1-carboxylic-acid synthase [Solirubrobacteraceae bacterium]